MSFKKTQKSEDIRNQKTRIEQLWKGINTPAVQKRNPLDPINDLKKRETSRRVQKDMGMTIKRSLLLTLKFSKETSRKTLAQKGVTYNRSLSLRKGLVKEF